MKDEKKKQENEKKFNKRKEELKGMLEDKEKMKHLKTVKVSRSMEMRARLNKQERSASINHNCAHYLNKSYADKVKIEVLEFKKQKEKEELEEKQKRLDEEKLRKLENRKKFKEFNEKKNRGLAKQFSDQGKKT